MGFADQIRSERPRGLVNRDPGALLDNGRFMFTSSSLSRIGILRRGSMANSTAAMQVSFYKAFVFSHVTQLPID